MPDTNIVLIAYVVISVLLFILLGIAILVMIDHKARIPGRYHDDPFHIVGVRREHPVISFLTTVILGAVIVTLLAESAVVIGERLGLFDGEVKPELLAQLKEERFSEKMRHFHNVPHEETINLGRKTACFHCHGDYPHSKTRMIRTLLNMHTQFIGCMTCHTDEKKVPESGYRFAWLNYSGIPVKGRPYGIDIDPATGYLIPTDDVYSKIVVYATVSGEEILMEATEDKPEVREFLAVKDRLSDVDREAMKKRMHRWVRRKGRFCDRCHAPEADSFLPLRALGFSEIRIGDLTNLNISGIVKKYKKFYLPNLLRTDGGKD